jgi:amino-acid N-acetyltransferase
MEIYPVTQNDFSKAINLLKKNDLPTQDITGTTKLFVMLEGNDVVGVVGLEAHDHDGLIRSLCVSEEKRNTGLGAELVEFMETYAPTQNAHCLFLLTTTASDYFSKRGYEEINRNKVPQPIQESTQFTTVCPSTAVVMRKRLT